MKLKVNVTVDDEAWRSFRVECLRRGITASSEIDAFIRARVAEWMKKRKEQR